MVAHGSPGDGTRPRGGADRSGRLRHAVLRTGAEAGSPCRAGSLRTRAAGRRPRSRFRRPRRRPTRLSRSSQSPRRSSMPASGNSPSVTSRARGASSTRRSTCSCSPPTARGTTPVFASTSSGSIDRISAYEMAALAEGDGFTEKRYEPASIDALLAESTFATAAASAKTGEIVASDLERTRARHAHPAERAGARLRRAVPGTPARVVPGRPPAGCAVPPDDPGRLPRRGASARPGVRAAHRERVQARRPVASQGQGRLAVHGGDRRRERAQARLVHRRAVGPREGHPRGGGVSPDPGAGLRRRLAPGAGLVQRRPRAGPARHEALRPRRFLDAGRQAQQPSPRDARIRADGPGGDRDRAQPRPVRIRRGAGRSRRIRHGEGASAGRPSEDRRMGRHDREPRSRR